MKIWKEIKEGVLVLGFPRELLTQEEIGLGEPANQPTGAAGAWQREEA